MKIALFLVLMALSVSCAMNYRTPIGNVELRISVQDAIAIGKAAEKFVGSRSQKGVRVILSTGASVVIE